MAASSYGQFPLVVFSAVPLLTSLLAQLLYDQITTFLARYPHLRAVHLCMDPDADHEPEHEPDSAEAFAAQAMADSKEDELVSLWTKLCPPLRQIEFVSGRIWSSGSA